MDNSTALLDAAHGLFSDSLLGLATFVPTFAAARTAGAPSRPRTPSTASGRTRRAVRATRKQPGGLPAANFAQLQRLRKNKRVAAMYSATRDVLQQVRRPKPPHHIPVPKAITLSCAGNPGLPTLPRHHIHRVSHLVATGRRICGDKAGWLKYVAQLYCASVACFTLCDTAVASTTLPLGKYREVLAHLGRMQSQLEALPEQVHAGCMVVDASKLHDELLRRVALWKSTVVERLNEFLRAAIAETTQFVNDTLVSTCLATHVARNVSPHWFLLPF